MKRVKLTLEYDGTAYAGWQRQANAMTVQQRLEEAIEALTGTPHGVTGASRTDSGVHARGQVAHFDTNSAIPPEKWCYALNTRLPDDIRVVRSCAAQSTFHARFHATAKQYAYTIANTPHARAIGRQYAWHVPYALDVEAMRRAAAELIGTHDFVCCMASGGESKTTIRTITKAEVSANGDEVRFVIEGDGFLYNMVRILAGTLVYIGQGKLEESAVARALMSGDRLLLGPTAPAHGLCLNWVRYDHSAC